MATLINGNLNSPIYAAQDADLLAAICGNTTCVTPVGEQFAETLEDANTIMVADGVIITKEGRRIQIDVGDVEEVIVPTGSQGTTKYYIIGFHLYTDGSGNQLAETFIDEVESSTATITENMFKDGETEVYVSLYRITRNGLNLEDLTLILPEIPSLGDLKDDVEQINTDLSDIRSNDFGTEVNITVGTDYTCPSDGVVLYGAYGLGLSTLLVNGVGVGAVYGGNQANISVIGSFRVFQGDTVKITVGAEYASQANIHKFIPTT